jgi:fluoroacetyl-CoA thioesterase
MPSSSRASTTLGLYCCRRDTFACCPPRSPIQFRPMAKQVPIGAKGTAEERVQYEHTLTAHNHLLPPVYSTPDMIRLMETAGFHALHPFCEPGEISVGTAIQVEHRLPVGINAVVHATAEVAAIEGRFFKIKVAAFEGKRELGSGVITRAIIRVDDFLKRHDIPKP